MQLPLTDSELRKAAGNEEEKDKDKADKPQEKPAASSRLVTSDGTYATQSAFSMTQTKKKVCNCKILCFLFIFLFQAKYSMIILSLSGG